MTDVTDVIEDHAVQVEQASAELPTLLRASSNWTDQMVTAAAIPVHDMPIVTIGGGIGSFVMADYLRIAGGLPTSDIQVLSNLGHPWQTYQRLAIASQIGPDDRIRSDAASRPDNIWGFPSYALSEAARNRTIVPLLQVLLEPVFSDFYTPRLRMVLESLEREARRIRYWDMLQVGDVELVRKRVEGGYFVVFAGSDRGEPVRRVVRCRDVHLAVGYAGLRFLPELQEFRASMNDYHRLVNAYEHHEHVYAALLRRPGTVVVRGAGIVASRVLERLIRDREEHGRPVQIVHVLRTYFAGPHGRQGPARRHGQDGFAYQGFNYPKSVWGGQLRAKIRSLHGDERTQAYRDIDGTTTAWRRDWQRQLRSGRAEGWYRVVNAYIDDIRPHGDGLLTRLRSADGHVDVQADYVIDCTGLNAKVTEHQVLNDLLEHAGARVNTLGRIDVDQSFAVIGGDSRMGRMYLTGAAALGGPFPGVDTFLGLQIAAQEVVDDIARRGFCRRIGLTASLAGWLRWVTGRQI